MNGQVMAIAAVGAMLYFAALGAVDRAKWIGHEVKKGGVTIVHVLKHIPHPHKG